MEKVESVIKNTSFQEGFDIFNEILSHDFDIVNHNRLKLFMLGTENKCFNYDELYNYLYDNLANYVYDRKINKEAKDDYRKAMSIFGKAVDCLKSVESTSDKGAGAELGEILLYLFLEQDFKAPKLFSKVELKMNAEDYVKGSDGIHYKIRVNNDGKKVVQLIVGEAKIYKSIIGANGALSKAFESIKNFLNNPNNDYRLIDNHLMNQLVNEDEAKEIKNLILQKNPRTKREIVFGIFIGYENPYIGETDDNDTFDKNIIIENKKHIISLKQSIIDEINKYHVCNYEFQFYFLPFHDASKDRKHLIKLLKEKATAYRRE